MNCNEINQAAAELKMKFEAGEVLKANDMDLLVELTLAARDCSGEVSSIDSSYYKQPLSTITDLTNLNYLLLVDQQRHYVKETNIEYIWQAEATEGDYEPFDKGLNTQGFWKKMSYTLFSESLENRLLDSVYENLSQSISVSPTSFEKGVETDLTFTWRVTKNDDTLNSVTVDEQDKLSEATGVNRTYTVNNQVKTKTIALVTNLTRNTVTGSTFTLTNTATSNAYVPQFTGKTGFSLNNYDNISYSFLTDNLDKHIQNNHSIDFTKTYTGEKSWILSTKNNVTIKDGNDFTLTVGGQFDSTFWILREVTFLLENGNVETGYLYISRDTLNGTFTFKIS